MVGKSRSELANDRRGYRCVRHCLMPIPIPEHMPTCSSFTVISLEDIATNSISFPKIWLLNKDTTISICQILEIPLDQQLNINDFMLINNGTINLKGKLRNAGLNSGNNSIIINNGIINIDIYDNINNGVLATLIENVGAQAQTINNGIINNNGYIVCQTYGIINNNVGGRINNNIGIIRVNAFGTFNNNGIIINKIGANIINNGNGIPVIGTITNNGSITNYGIITNGLNANPGGQIDTAGTIYNANGIIYNSNDAIINNSGTIVNIGIINNADGLSSCGTGTINNTGTISGTGTIGTSCPP